jgi:hypothetical protein
MGLMIDFSEWRKMIDQERQLRMAYEKELSKATKITTSYSQSGKSQGFREGSKVEDGGIALSVIDDELEKVKAYLADQLELLNRAAGKMKNPVYKTALRLRYEKGIGPRKVAEKMNFSENHIFKLLYKAETMVNEILKVDSQG